MTKVATEKLSFDRRGFENERLIALYKALLTPRLIEEKMLKLLRQGKISKWFSGIGQEAISVGVTEAVASEEYLFTLHRNLGVFTSRNIPLYQLFGQWQGKPIGFTKGRDRSFHFGAPQHHIIGMISHLGPQLSMANGVAMAHLLRKEKKVAIAFTGEGATSEGEFHEALNVAAVWSLPVLFVIENNGYGLSTPTSQQYKCTNLADKGIGYGMAATTIDGNNVLEVFRTVQKIVKKMRKEPAPFLLECQTFRQRGHEEASGTKYVPQALMDYWQAKDPVHNFETFLLEENIITTSLVTELKTTIQTNIESEIKRADSSPTVVPDINQELADLYSPTTPGITAPKTGAKTNKRFVDAIQDGLRQAMESHDNLVLMGQDIGDYGGVFKVTEGFVDQFGADRVRNTPLCESAIIGAGLGLSIHHHKAMVEMQFADFVTCGFNQIVNNLAKLHYRWGQNADVVIRMPTGGGVAAGPFHSQSNEAWFTHTPGLKVVYPSSVYDAKGLLLAAFEDPNPIMFFEHKALYRKITAPIPDDYYTVEIGKAHLVNSGQDATIITYGMGVHWAMEVVKEMQVEVDILDLRTLLPIDYPSIDTSIQKTGKALILHEDSLFGGIGGEISAYISEHLFEYLDGPVLRAASLDTPIPFNSHLEQQFLPIQRLRLQLEKLLGY